MSEVVKQSELWTPVKVVLQSISQEMLNNDVFRKPSLSLTLSKTGGEKKESGEGVEDGQYCGWGCGG